ncbi:MAG: hypothetical protein GXY05_03485 [Clostridiales bacterium]|nr:hypothetical protein [Clostridiales bacterium]
MKTKSAAGTRVLALFTFAALVFVTVVLFRTVSAASNTRITLYPNSGYSDTAFME